MLDIETMGVRPTSAIVQIGACYFDRVTGEIGKEFSVNIGYTGTEDDSRFTTDQSTVDWWKDQPQKTKDVVFSNAMSIDRALSYLAPFLKQGECLWSHATFDAPILCNAFVVCGIKMPIHYRGMRDIRTLMDLADHHSGRPRGGIHHNALDDCKFQVGYVVEAMNKIKSAIEFAEYESKNQPTDRAE